MHLHFSGHLTGPGEQLPRLLLQFGSQTGNQPGLTAETGSSVGYNCALCCFVVPPGTCDQEADPSLSVVPGQGTGHAELSCHRPGSTGKFLRELRFPETCHCSDSEIAAPPSLGGFSHTVF